MDKGFAVIFDMDGVLVENSDIHDKAWQMTCRKYGRNVSADAIKTIFGGTNKIFVSRLLGINDERKINAIAIEKEALYRKLYEETIQLPEGLLNLLKEIKRKRIPMAVATSAPTENVDFVLDRLNIRNYFDILVDETYVTKGKPDPEIYLITAEKLGLKPENCIVIEDSVFGIQSAKDAGMKVIGITTTFNEEQIKKAHLIIHSFKELDIKKIKSLINL
jgi:haloacid dehalogenase superfamily, subfamily IA, variant 3 with third motif having DD or ED/haloacid dehalogenase superfamily, subfamily IA, variant 1 with third motif having Dx(3-4)D or Dx(3-4)E/beta-phosphoglucomutase family hydrolase